MSKESSDSHSRPESGCSLSQGCQAFLLMERDPKVAGLCSQGSRAASRQRRGEVGARAQGPAEELAPTPPRGPSSTARFPNICQHLGPDCCPLKVSLSPFLFPIQGSHDNHFKQIMTFRWPSGALDGWKLGGKGS